MGSTTSKGYPYPVGSDRVADGDNAIEALARAADSKAGISAAGKGVLQFTNSTSASVAVTFPSGAFTAPPTAVVVTATDSTVVLFGVSAITATGCTITGRHYQNSASSYTISFAYLARS